MAAIYGSISQLVVLGFKQDGFAVNLTPNSGTTYSAARAVQLPPGDADSVLLSEDGTQTVSNKSISGSANTLSAIPLSALNALTASRALVSDGSGVISAATTTATEIGYVNGVTSAIQTQIDSKVAKAGDTMTGNLVMANQQEVRFSEATGGGTNYVGLKAAAALAVDLTYTLPAAAPASNGYVMASTTAGVMSWVAQTAALPTFKATWIIVDGTTKVVTHNLGTTDISVQLFDIGTGATIMVDDVVRTDGNTLTLTASEVPGVSGWRILIQAV